MLPSCSVFLGSVAPTVSLLALPGDGRSRPRCPKNKNQMFERAAAATEAAVAHGDRPGPLKGPLPIGSDI